MMESKFVWSSQRQKLIMKLKPGLVPGIIITHDNFSGKISCDELTKVLTEMGKMKMTVEEAEEFIAMVDKDGDSMLDYSEFVMLFTEKLHN